jgi:hypothetical protein
MNMHFASTSFFTAVFRPVYKNREKRLLAKSCLSIRLSVYTEQLGSHWTDIHKISYLTSFRKSADKIQASLKYDKNN